MAVTEHANSTPIRGLAACRWYAQFHYDPIACIRDSYRRHGLLASVGNIAPFVHQERIYALAVGIDFNRQVLGDPAIFRPSEPPRRWMSERDDSALHRLSYGLTRMTGSTHQRQRRLIAPPLQRKAVEGYYRTIAETTEELLDEWAQQPALDMWSQMRALSLRISSRTLFGLDNSESAYVLGHMIQEWLTRTYSMGVWIWPFNTPGTPYRRLHEHAERLQATILRMIDIKRTASEQGQDMFSLLTNNLDEREQEMTEAELVGQACTMFGASYETMSSALTWTLFLLAQHPGVMADLQDELLGTLHGGPPASEQLDKLPLLEAVINESLRLLPPVPLTVKRTTCEVELGRLRLQRGDRVILGHYMTHRLPDLYENPNQFQPQRWLHITPSSYAYVAFSAGPRTCVGAPYAMVVMKLALSMILQRFRLTVVPNSRIDRLVQVTMQPKFGMPMVLHPQDRQFRAVPVRGNIHDMVRLPSIS